MKVQKKGKPQRMSGILYKQHRKRYRIFCESGQKTLGSRSNALESGCYIPRR